MKLNHNLLGGINGLVVPKRGEDVRDGGKIDSYMQRKSSALSSLSDLKSTALFDLMSIRVFNVCAVHHNLLALL